MVCNYGLHANALRTLPGHSSCGYPNWSYLGAGQNALSANVTAMFDDPAKHLAYIIREVRSRGATVLEPPKEAEQAWGDTIRGRASTNNDFLKSCTPGYYNNEVAELGFGLLGQVLHTGR
jgi:cyclohexanone monooxygenase